MNYSGADWRCTVERELQKAPASRAAKVGGGRFRFEITRDTVRARYKRQLIQLKMNKSGLHGLEWKTHDP